MSSDWIRDLKSQPITGMCCRKGKPSSVTLLFDLMMPPMTMVFRVKDPKMLDGLAVGDRVRFDAAKVDGNYTVTAIAKAP